MFSYMLTDRAPSAWDLVFFDFSEEMVIIEDNGSLSILNQGDVIVVNPDTRIVTTDFITDNVVCGSRCRIKFHQWFVKGFIKEVS
jgi:hypothetical protein